MVSKRDQIAYQTPNSWLPVAAKDWRLLMTLPALSPRLDPWPTHEWRQGSSSEVRGDSTLKATKVWRGLGFTSPTATPAVGEWHGAWPLLMIWLAGKWSYLLTLIVANMCFFEQANGRYHERIDHPNKMGKSRSTITVKEHQGWKQENIWKSSPSPTSGKKCSADFQGNLRNSCKCQEIFLKSSRSPKKNNHPISWHIRDLPPTNHPSRTKRVMNRSWSLGFSDYKDYSNISKQIIKIHMQWHAFVLTCFDSNISYQINLFWPKLDCKEDQVGIHLPSLAWTHPSGLGLQESMVLAMEDQWATINRQLLRQRWRLAGRAHR